LTANDIQRELIFPSLLRKLRDEGIQAAFEFIPSGHPTPGMMRDARYHLTLTPFPADATDIIQKTVLKERRNFSYKTLSLWAIGTGNFTKPVPK
jgi:hypothetical protein